MKGYVRTTESITLDCALEITHEALTHARRLGKTVAIVVLDSASNPLVSIRMDAAPMPCQAIAQRKATTALAFSVSTKLWDERFAGLSSGVKQGLPLQDGLAFFGGGEPIVQNGKSLGSVGVSGATESEDCVIAGAAVERFKTLIGEP